MIIKKLERSKKLTIKHDEMLKRSVEWLKNHQHPDGYWGYESVADTGLVFLALITYGIRDEIWSIKGKYEGGLLKASKWLKDVLNVDNWENNLWDTSICFQALYRYEIRDDWIFRVLEWIKRTCEERAEKLPLHHLAQAIQALLDAGLEEDARKVCEIIIYRMMSHMLDKDNYMDPYIVGQVLDALVRAGYTPGTEVISVCESNLRNFLKGARNKGISEATFQDVMMAFTGLASLLGGNDDELMNSILAEVFKSPERYKKDGFWYHDAKKTAFALIGISKLKEVRKIDEFPYRIYKVITNYQKELEELLTNLKEEYETRLKTLKQGYLWISISFLSIIISLLLVLVLTINNPVSQLIIGGILFPVFLSSATKTYLLFKGK